MLRKAFLTGVLLLSIFSALPLYAQNSNAGFIPSNIWYSKDPFIEGEKIKIYTLVFNPDERQMSGTVTFFDKNVILGKKNFIVVGRGVEDISIDWTVTVGSHVIFGKIENARFLLSNGTYESAYLDRSETEESRRTISKKTTEQSSSLDSSSVPRNDKKLENLVLENTPSFISKPVISAVNAIERWRGDMANSESKIRYFFQNKIIFYGLSLLIIFFIVRLVWRRFF